MNEFEIIERCFDVGIADPDVVLGIGDDAALVRADGLLAVATDTLVAGVHFLHDMNSSRLAARAVAVNVSDMAAMGARPRWYTLALTMPRADDAWLEAFAKGLHAAAAQYGLTLIGGDTTRGPLTITLQLIGSVAGTQGLRRSGARPGDLVFVTGSLGDAAAGLASLKQSASASGAAAQFLRDRFELPTPRVSAGLALNGLASAAIDVSDGLLADLGHICRASGCAAHVDVERLPLSPALLSECDTNEALHYALTGGDDYELCFAAAPEDAAHVTAALASVATPVNCIGAFERGSGVTCRRDGMAFTVAESGYVHF
jgi:thiamine-monophosphate kinase